MGFNNGIYIAQGKNTNSILTKAQKMGTLYMNVEPNIITKKT